MSLGIISEVYSHAYYFIFGIIFLKFFDLVEQSRFKFDDWHMNKVDLLVMKRIINIETNQT